MAQEKEDVEYQKVATEYLVEKESELEIMLKGLNEHKERDKLTMAEKRLLHRSVHNRYKEVLRDQHLKKNF